MKKNLLIGLAALAAVTITSCQKDQVINQVPQEQAIEFGTYLGRDAMTKGSVLNDDGLKTKGFGVFAYYTAQQTYQQSVTASTATPNFMYNQKVTYDTEWTYSPLKYWPNNNNDKISFFAYAPYSDDVVDDDSDVKYLNLSLNTHSGNPNVSIVISEDEDSHIDLTYATDNDSNNGTDLRIDQTKQTTTGTVNLLFKHALSRVGFKVEAVVDEINNVTNGQTDTDAGTTNIESTNTSISVNEIELVGKFYRKGTLDLKEGSWSSLENYKDGSDDDRKASYLLESGDFKTITIDNTKKQINDDDEYLMLLPKNFTSDDKIKIRINYTVTTTDGALSGGKSVITNNIESDEFNFNFEQGKAYNFVLHLGLTSVKLSATVDPWDNGGNGTDISVNVPINNAPAQP